MIERKWTPTQAEFDAFARVSGDDNPIHTDSDFSARTGFGRTVSHGMLIYAKLWQLLREACPGAIHQTQEMIFPNPAYAGEALILRVEPAGGQAVLTATRASDGAVCLQGKAVLA